MTVTNHAKHAFYYVLICITLGFVAVGSGQILFSIIEHFLPDVVNAYNASSSGDDSVLRFGLSSLIVAAPLFYVFTRLVNRDLEKNEIESTSGIRRWLTYGIILIASVTAIGDLIASFNGYLAGELTLRFALKALVILAISGAVLSYYTFDLTRKDFHRGALLRVYNIGFVLAIIATFVIGISIATSPTELRARSADTQRVNNLQAIDGAVSQYFSEHGRVPETLAVLLADKKIFENQTVDATTKVAYDYRATDAKHVELCATFERAATRPEDGIYDAAWQHEAGHACFTREVQSWAIDAATTKAQPAK